MASTTATAQQLTSRLRAAGPSLWLAILWTVAGVLAIFIPVVRWNKEKQAYYSYYGRWQEYNQNGEQQQDNNQQNNNYNYQVCKWWQWGCRKRVNYYNNMYNNNGGGSGDNVDLPGWFTYFGGETEQERRWREENGEQKQMKWLYVWTLILFVGLVVYGTFIFYKKRSLLPLTIALLVMVQFTLLSMLLLAHGVIETDGREMEDSLYGWYGQPGVLSFMSDIAYTIFCLVALVCFAIYAIVARWRARRAAGASSAAGDGTDVENGYKPYTDPEVRVT